MDQIEVEKQLRQTNKKRLKRSSSKTFTYPNVGCPSNEMTGVGGRQRPALSDDAGVAIEAAIAATMARERDFIGIVEVWRQVKWRGVKLKMLVIQFS